MKKLLLTALLVVAACADNRSSVEILGRAAPGDATSCKFSAEGDRLLGAGALDVSPLFPHTYDTVVYVHNNLADPQELAPGSVTDAKAWRATAAKVRINPREYVMDYGASPGLLDASGTNVLPLDGATVPPQGKTSQGVNLLSAALTNTFAGQVAAGTTRLVVLGVTLEGETMDGRKLDSSEWYFPIYVCNGCLLPTTWTCDPDQTLKANNCFGFGQDTVPSCQ